MRVLLLIAALLIADTTKSAHSKSGQSLLSEHQILQARENVQNIEQFSSSFESTKNSIEWVLEMSDEELWNFIPSADQPRAVNVRMGFDCPIHGIEVFKKGGHYPWIMDREHPYKLKCPVGGETYPSNDFDSWQKNGKKEKLDTSEPYVDDGYGWVDAEGNHYWFVAYYIFWQRWRTDILPVIPRLAQAYTLTGDSKYSHKAAVMLARVASEYPKMDYGAQSYHNGQYPSKYKGKILDLNWEGAGSVVPMASAYDQIYNGIDADSELKLFLASKGIDDAKDFIETNFLQQAAKAIMDGVIEGNMNYQNQLALVAVVLDNDDPAKGATTKQMIDWIMDGGGEMNTLLYNGVSRDGSGSEESLGYMGIWTAAFLNLATRLKPMGLDLFDNPRLKKMVDFYIDATVADRFWPTIGDALGDMTGGMRPEWSAGEFKTAYGAWGDERYAKVLNRIGWPKPGIYDAQTPDTARKSKTDPLGTALDLKSRDLGGFGLAVLETGKGDDKRAATMQYGTSGAWHGHDDRLNISMWAHGMCVLPDMGYPAHWGDKAYTWTMSTPSHYCVEINEKKQYKVPGRLHLFASSPGVQVMDASAEAVYSEASLYRRTVAMVDISEVDSYLVDIFRVKGGQTHDYIFHGLPFGEFSVDGITLGAPQTKGTLLGEDIEFGKYREGFGNGGYQWLTSPRRGKPGSSWSANWYVKDKNIGLRMTMLKGSAGEVIVADGEPEAKPGYPEKMEYVLARNKTGSSSYVAVIEPYKSKPEDAAKGSIRRILPIESDNSAPESLIAVKVGLPDRTDYVFSSLDGSTNVTMDSGKIEFGGEFGFVSEDNRGLRSMSLVNGTTLRRGKNSIQMKAIPRAKVVVADYKSNSITLDMKVPAPSTLIGQVITISNPMHSASYTIKNASNKDNQTTLELAASMIEGIGVIESIDESGKTVKTNNRLGGYGMKWTGWSIPGRALVNESLTDSWLITAHDNGKWQVHAQDDIVPKMAQADGKPNKYFYVGEVNVGDEVMIPAIANVTRDGSKYIMRGTAPFEFSDSEGKRVNVTAEMLAEQG